MGVGNGFLQAAGSAKPPRAPLQDGNSPARSRAGGRTQDSVSLKMNSTQRKDTPGKVPSGPPRDASLQTRPAQDPNNQPKEPDKASWALNGQHLTGLIGASLLIGQHPMELESASFLIGQHSTELVDASPLIGRWHALPAGECCTHYVPLCTSLDTITWTGV